MKVVATSDLHLRYDFDVPECDVFIVAGDILGNGSLTQLMDFNIWLGRQKSNFKHCLVTPGNHDKCFQTSLYTCKEILTNARIVIDEEVEIGGKRFYLSPWTPRFGEWYWMLESPEQSKEVWDKIPEGLDVLVTHGPPFRILDLTDGGAPENVGCMFLSDRLAQMPFDKRPLYHVFGHIHHSYGRHYGGVRTTYFNVAHCNERYQGVNPPIQFEI